MNLYYQDIFNILKEYYEKDKFLKNTIDIYIKNNQRDEFSTITDYSYGIVRNDLLLDNIITELIKKIKSKDKIYFKILFYGILFRKNVKREIFVNDFIRFIKKKSGVKKSGFYNGVIRNFLRNDNILNKLKKNKQIYHSIPKDLYTYIELNIKDEEFKKKIYDKMIAVPNFYFRKTKSIQLWKNIQRLGDTTESSPAQVIKMSDIKDDLLKGKIAIQDISSQMIAYILEPSKDDYIADFCAAPGGKSKLLSDLTNNKANIISIEVNKSRFEKMRLNFEDYSNLTPLLLDASKEILINNKKQYFDKILVDAPCSALGTISKSPDKKYRFKDINLNDYNNIQLSILNNALKHLKTSGSLVYSVCTFTKEETIDVVDAFLKENKGLVELFDFETPDKKFKGNKLYTGNYYDGDLFFITRFRKLI